MKRILLILAITMSALITFDTFAAVDPCHVNPELCPERPRPPAEPPRNCDENSKRLPRFQRVTLQGMPLPKSSSINSLTAVLSALKSDLPGLNTVKRIAAQPDSYNGVFNVIDSNNCEYIYNISVEYKDLGDIKTAVLKSNTCEVAQKQSLKLNSIKTLGGVCCSGFPNPGPGCDPGC